MAIKNGRLQADEYAENFSDIHPPFETRDAALVEANRCIFCYDAPCTKSCPTEIDVPKFIKQITTDNIRGSAKTIFSANIFGGGCARVCPVEKLCEGACVFNLMDEAPIAIAKLQRYSTQPAITDKWKLFNKASATGNKVAVIGAGPAGLSCAHSLARYGVEVTVFEKEMKAGGLMTYGIAAYKVSPEFCEAEVDFILSVGGINVKYGMELGQNISLDELRHQYDAVFIGIGVGLARPLLIPGEQLQGVTNALSFIYQIRTSGYPKVPVGDKVVVIGMGMTAIDAATQAKRLGASEVTLAYRRSIDEMPCTMAELDIAMLDGCQIEWLAAPLEIIGADGIVNRIVFSRMALGEPDASGRKKPFDTGETITIEADMIIKATGQMPFEELIVNSGVSADKGRIEVTGSGITNIGGIFAGGDAVNGGKEVVDAVQAGKLAATEIINYLTEKSLS